MVFTFIQISPRRDFELHGWEKQNLKCVHWGRHASETLILPSPKPVSPVLTIIYDPSFYWNRMFSHIYYLQRQNPFSLFFLFAFFVAIPTMSVSQSTLSLVLTFLWIAFTELLILLQIKSTLTKMDVIAPISTMKRLRGRKWKQQISEKTLVVLCCHWLYIGVAWGGFGGRCTIQFLQYAHTEIERPTLRRRGGLGVWCEATDHCSQPTLSLYCRCQEFLIKSSVNTLFFYKVDYMWLYCKLVIYVWFSKPPLHFPFFSLFSFFFFFKWSRRQTPPNLTSYDCRSLCFEA